MKGAGTFLGPKLMSATFGAFCIFQYFIMVHTYWGWEREELLFIQKVNCGMIFESHLL